MQYRHGDVMLERVEGLPVERRKLPHTTLALGEVTGHSHRLRPGSKAALYLTGRGDGLALDVQADEVELIHEEHATIHLPRGVYRVWRQREYSPESIRIIRD